MEELRGDQDERWLAMVEGRWEEFGADPPEVFRARVATTVDELVDALSPGSGSSRSVTAASSTSRSALVLGVDRHALVRAAATRRCTA